MYSPYTPNNTSSSNNSSSNNNNNSSSNNNNTTTTTTTTGGYNTYVPINYSLYTNTRSFLPTNKYWTEVTVSNWVDQTYTQSEIYIKIESDRIKCEELEKAAANKEGDNNVNKTDVNINNSDDSNTTKSSTTTSSPIPMNVDNDGNPDSKLGYYINTRSKEKAKRELQSNN